MPTMQESIAPSLEWTSAGLGLTERERELLTAAIQDLEWIPIHPPSPPRGAIDLARLFGLNGLSRCAETDVVGAGALTAIGIEARDGRIEVYALDQGAGLIVVATSGEGEPS